MSPGSRKKPRCHSCGALMAGHKRPNGSPICPPKTDPKASTSQTSPPASPSPLRREEQIIIPADGYLHRRNPNWVQPPPTILSALDRSDTPTSWVSTEPADDIPVKREATITVVDTQVQPLFEAPATPRSSPSASSVASSSSTLTRSLTDALINCVPLVTIFGTPKEELSKVTREARQKGLFTAVLRRNRQKEVKNEALRSPARQNSWMVLMGRDVDAVADWCELHDKETIREAELGQRNEGKIGTLTKIQALGCLSNLAGLVLLSFLSSGAMLLLLSFT